MSGFQAFYDSQGDLQIQEGVVIDLRSGTRFEVGALGPLTELFRDRTAEDLRAVTEAMARSFVGGSGRNLVATGPGGLAGFFSPHEPGFFRRGELTLEVTSATVAALSDGTDVIANYTGAAAPLGSYTATTHGEDAYNGGVGFSMDLAAEEGAPGAVPDARVAVSSGTVPGGIYAATDAANYVCAADADFTIELLSDGVGNLKHDGTIIAVRAEGSTYDPSGRYEALETAFFYNPQPLAGDGSGVRAASNPFGILTVEYSWSGSPDLDTGTRFLDDAVGFGQGGLGTYMSWTGDNTSSGSETVEIDLAQAWEDGVISSFADVTCLADWYPPAGGSGPAQLDISYAIGGIVVATLSAPIRPAIQTPAATRVQSVRVAEDGTLEAYAAPWTASVQRIPEPVRAGFGWIDLHLAGGELTSVSGPYFATALPASDAATVHFPLLQSDGLGGLKALHTGTLIWPGAGQETVMTTLADYLALAPAVQMDGRWYVVPKP